MVSLRENNELRKKVFSTFWTMMKLKFEYTEISKYVHLVLSI